MTFHAKLIKGGKIVIPAKLRRELGFKEGDRLVIERDGSGFVVRSFAEVIRDIQRTVKAMVKTPFTVDDYLAEKYAEAERENRE